MSGRRRVGAVGAVVGVVAAGAAAGLAAERYAVGRTRNRPDPEALEPFGALPSDRVRRVVATDGVPLHVEEVGPEKAPVTVVFCHGYTQRLHVWHYQRLALAGKRVRLVFWDQRSHGLSGRSARERCTIDQLGADLLTVLEATAPTGRVVLVGHSMGGMTIMALADARPDLFGERVVGVALLSTSPGRLAEVAFGLPALVTPVRTKVLPWLTRGMQQRPGAFERGRRLGTDLAFLATRRWAFGSGDVSPSLVEFVERMTAETPVDVIADFYGTLMDHDKLEALQVLRGVETLLLGGTKDLITPVAHTSHMGDQLPEAHVVLVEGAGHMVQLERAPLVTLHLQALLRRATRSASRTA